MYLMSGNRTLIGTDATGNIVQLEPSDDNVPKLLHFETHKHGDVITYGPLRDYRVEVFPHGMAFIRNKKYLRAVRGSTKTVTDADARSPWETFGTIPEDKISSFIEAMKSIGRACGGDAGRLSADVQKLRAEGKPVKVHFGCGQVPRSGFLNVDIALGAPNFFINNFNEYYVFPFGDVAWDLPDNCVDYIFHEDFIEHITQLMQIQFLAETLRVLRPGCWHRVNTPNVLAAMKRHSTFKEGFRGVYTGEKQWGHISIFSPWSLKEMAELVGYREVVFTTRHHGVSPYAERDYRPGPDRDEILGNIYADLLK